jgi:dTDP-4-dehydrorhamnose 3,5-epimerase-like enzyme
MSVRLIHFPKIEDARGNLTFLQSSDQVPFEIKRVFWTYDVPGGQGRGGHAYKSNHELIIALSGSFDVILNIKGEKKAVSLNRSYTGLYLPPMVWRHLENFSTNAVALTLASKMYEPEDYIRDMNEYQSFE